MSLYSVPGVKSPKAAVPDSRKIPSSPKPTRLNAKAEYYSMGIITENKEATRQSQTDKKKPALEIQLSRPVNDSRRAITQSRSPPSFKNVDPDASRFNVLKEYLSPTSAKSGTLSTFAKKESKIVQKDTSILDASIEQSVKANSRVEKPKVHTALTSRPSTRTTNPKSEPATPFDRLTKRLAIGLSPSTAKLRDSSRDYPRASETDRIIKDAPDLVPKNMKPQTPSSILRKNSKFGFDSGRESSSRSKNSIAGQTDQNTARSSKRFASPSASTTNIHKKTPSDVTNESNTSKPHLSGNASSANIRRSVRISEEDLGLSGLNAINEADGNKDSQNGSCSPDEKREESQSAKPKKLSLIIPTVQINAGDIHDGTKSAKNSVSAMRSMFYNLNHSIIEESPVHNENKSAHLFSSSTTNLEEKAAPGPAPEEKQKMYPSRNSDFNFQMKYFKPIEEAKLEEFIQTINDSKRLKNEPDNSNIVDEDSSNNTTVVITSKSPEKRDKSSLHLPRSQVATPTVRNQSPSMANLLSPSREKSLKRTGIQTPHSRNLSPQPLIKAPVKSRETDLFKTNDKKQEKNSYPSQLDPKVRLRSPIKKWEQGMPRSPLRSGTTSTAHTLRNSLDAKEPNSFVRSSFSRQHQNSKLAEEMESVPVVIDLESKESKKKAEHGNSAQGGDKFSNLDKLLAQLRNNPLKQMEFSLADTEDSEKGLFNPEANEEAANTESQVNKSFARNLMKFSNP